MSEQLQSKYLPKRPSTNGSINTSFTAQDAPPGLSNPFEQKLLPTQPIAPPPPPPSDANLLPHDDRQRASISLPSSSSSNSLAPGRFYSQFQSGSNNETPTSSRHLSQPLPSHSRSPSPGSFSENRAAHPLSPLEELRGNQIQEEKLRKQETQQDQNQDSQLGTLSETQEQEEQEEHGEHQDRMHGERLRHELYGETPGAPTNKQNHPGQQHELQGDLKQQSLAPQLSIRSRKPVNSDSTSQTYGNNAPRNIAVSNASISTHPHRCESEARVVNDPPQPVELAITADDSSEEIFMSPTSYPGQEWTPVHL